MDRIADYLFDRHLGADDRGSFYLAQPPDRIGVDAEYVAVKVWPTAADADLVQEAMREIEALRRGRTRPFGIPHPVV